MRLYKLKKCKRVHGIHFTPDGTRLLAVGGEEVRMIDSAVWLDLASGENVSRIDQFAECYAVNSGLTRYLLGGASQWNGIDTIQWKVFQDGDHWHTFSGDEKSVLPSVRSIYGLAFDAAGERLAVGIGPAFWRPSRAEPRRWQFGLFVLRFDPLGVITRIPLAEGARAIVFNHNASQVGVAGGVDGDRSVKVFDIATGRPVLQFDPPGTVTRCVLFTPDERLVVANGRYVYVLPRDTPEPLFTLAGHPKQVNAVALTHDGRSILTASHDGTIRVWDAATGAGITSFDWKIGAVTAVAFAPDGLTCAAAGRNGKVVVWDVDE